MKILVFNPGREGGIVKYAWHQAAALGQSGCRVMVLCDEGQEPAYVNGYDCLPVCLGDLIGRHKNRLARGFFLLRQLLHNQWVLFRAIHMHRPDAVLLGSYMEYFSPLWVWLQLAAKKLFGVRFIAVLHDPVRDFALGPKLWHELSVALAYWPVDALFVHEVVPKEARVPRRIQIHQVPHGLFPLSTPLRSCEEVRKEWNVPAEAVAFLSFGFIRDSKNVDLLIRALLRNPNAYLIVMGRVQSESANRPVSFYEELACQLGVSERVRFLTGFVPEESVSSYMHAADVIAMTYGASFRSQSGVLNFAAFAEKPVLASCGSGPLKSCVEKFGLGKFVVPDDLDDLTDGMREICDLVQVRRDGKPWSKGEPVLDWAGYRTYASWNRNAEIIVKTVASLR